MKIKKFEELEIWRIAFRLTRDIYLVTNNANFSKDFGLKNQIRRAIVSVSSNIVEGFERQNNNEFIRYLKIAKGSTGEVLNQVYIAYSVNYLQKEQFMEFRDNLKMLANKIGKFIQYLIAKRQNAQFKK